MNPPQLAGWNLGLRFGLEIGAHVGLGLGAWKLVPGPMRWVLAAAAPLGAAVAWGLFNVLDDPSRSGAAPVEVNGWVRLTLEAAVLLSGGIAVWSAGHHQASLGFAALAVVHYASSADRIHWLVQQ